MGTEVGNRHNGHLLNPVVRFGLILIALGFFYALHFSPILSQGKVQGVNVLLKRQAQASKVLACGGLRDAGKLVLAIVGGAEVTVGPGDAACAGVALQGVVGVAFVECRLAVTQVLSHSPSIHPQFAISKYQF